ncbi:MAG: hypothetical protein ABH880_01465 [Patescibacteria group bacterium]
MKAVTQESPMGCAIACCASRAGSSYRKMRALFEGGDIKDWTTGFYTKDIKKALNKVGIPVEGCGAKDWGNKRIPVGSIVFIERSKKYPAGHFLLKTENGWMDPWINFPHMKPAKSGFRKKLPGKVYWVIDTRDRF